MEGPGHTAAEIEAARAVERRREAGRPTWPGVMLVTAEDQARRTTPPRPGLLVVVVEYLVVAGWQRGQMRVRWPVLDSGANSAGSRWRQQV